LVKKRDIQPFSRKDLIQECSPDEITFTKDVATAKLIRLFELCCKINKETMKLSDARVALDCIKFAATLNGFSEASPTYFQNTTQILNMIAQKDKVEI
jgi:hypothetical protein